eukprot:Hpha_TRINITY_DN22908_c0_g1::TRINITY_DN22908_c0_g1_i1::g.153983::m.153983/K02330/POLB; DNA polymerase beta
MRGGRALSFVLAKAKMSGGSSKPARAAPAVTAAAAAKRPRTNHNAGLCDILLQMGAIEKDQGNPFKWKAYKVASDSLRNLDHKITSGKEASKLPGVGAKIAKRIDEILATGELSQLERYKEDPKVSVIQLFNKITGIGPKTAQALYDKGYRSIADLEKSKEPFTAHQRLGLKHFDDLLHRIPYDEVVAHAAIVEEEVRKVDKSLIVTVCGSFRRRHATSGDIDCLITHPLSHSESGANYIYLHKVADRLRARGLLLGTISEGEKKLMGVSRLPDSDPRFTPHKARRLDLSFYTLDFYWSAVLYFTGSAVFNVHMRAEAHKQGMILNEYGLYKLKPDGSKGERLPAESEEDYFKYLKIPYVKPEDREQLKTD